MAQEAGLAGAVQRSGRDRRILGTELRELLLLYGIRAACRKREQDAEARDRGAPRSGHGEGRAGG
jgi:hypothetical protein